MNRRQRRITQSRNKAAIQFRGKAYTIEEANALAVAEHRNGNSQAAISIYGLILSQAHRSADAYNNLGMILKELKRYDEALANFEKAIACDSEFIVAHINRGLLLQDMKRYEEALASCDKAITFNAGYADIHNHRGTILHELRRYGDALASYDKAIALKSNYTNAYNNRGNTLHKMQQYDAGLTSYDKAIALNPNYAEAYYNRGIILQNMARYEEALASFDKAYALNPDIPYIAGLLLFNHMYMCNWQGTEQILDKLRRDIEAGKLVSAPFDAVVTSLSLTQQKKCTEIHVQNKFPQGLPPHWNSGSYSHDKIHLGYFSADFHDHPTAYLMAELIELHDRSKFEITAFSFGPSANDPMRKRLERAFDHFIDVRAKSDAEIAALARKSEIDIAVDLKGFTKDSRPGIFALRPAPIQVNYLGYPGTMAASFMDYLIADPIIIPEEHRRYYTEKVVYLPDSYQVNDSSRKISEKIATRQEFGLPDNGFVFCCFNNNYKITPDVFDIWMRLLNKVEGSVLWLLQDNATAVENLRKEAELRGITANRLIFAPRIKLAEHLARHRLADLFLDTLPCNAHTTASDALWAGLPLLTCLGETFAGRVAASLLHAIGLPELVTHSHVEYETLALELANNPRKLSLIRQTLEKNRITHPLFNTKRFTKHIEDAYIKMHGRKKAGMLPDNIFVEPFM